jgi:drug/metabolite transporter (DMT)-like permease
MSRPVLLSLYALIVVIWSSTWVAIKFGLEETPPLLGAGIRFCLAGLVLLAVTRLRRRSLRTDRRLALVLAVFPFAICYALVYWAEQYIPSGLAAVLFGAMPLYVAVISIYALRDEPVSGWTFAGIGVAIGGLVLAFGESMDLGTEERALAGAIAGVSAPLAAAIGNVSIKRRGGGLDAVVLNGWGMFAGGVLLLAVSPLSEDWGSAQWTAQAAGAIGYLALVGSALPFVVLTILLRHLTAVEMSYVPLMIPFGALALGAATYDEPLTATSLAGAALVALGLGLAQWRRHRVAVAAAVPR